MKRIGMKILCFILCAGLILPGPWALPAYAEDESAEPVQAEEIVQEEEPVAEEEGTVVPEEQAEVPQVQDEQEEGIPAYGDYDAEEIAGDYFNQYFATLLKENLISCDGVEFGIDDEQKAMTLKGKAKTVVGSEIVIDKEFSFDGAYVDRFSFEGYSTGSQKVEIGFFLDGSNDPFFTCKLFRNRMKDVSKDISDLRLTGSHTVSFKIISCSEKDVDIVLKSFEFCESSIPVVYFEIDEEDGTIEAMNASEDHSVNCYGSMTIKVPEGYTSVDTGEELSGGTYDMEYVRGRGNSTWSKDKKPYKIKLTSKENLLGMGKNKHWVLLANYFDNSLLRNKITYWLGDQMGMKFTPDSEPVDVVMDGEYYGSYFLCEQVRVGENRVEIDDLEDEPSASSEPEITGGYLMAMFSNAEKRFSTSHGVEFGVESPEPAEDTDPAQYEYIKEYMQSVEDAIYGENFRNSEGVSYTELMDLDSTVRYHMMQEFSRNFDSYITDSTFLYKERDKAGEKGKLYWGPLWDFDYVAWGSTEYHETETAGWINSTDRGSKTWNERLLEDPEYVAALKDAWQQLKVSLTELTREGGQLDKYKNNLETSAAYNFEKWGYGDLWGYGDPPEGLSYDYEVERLRDWIDDRAAWVDENIDTIAPSLTDVSFTDPEGTLLFTKSYYTGRRFGELPAGPEKEGCIFTGWERDYEYTLDEALARIGTSVDELLTMFAPMFGEETAWEMIYSFAGDLKGTEVIEPETRVEADMTLRAGYIDKSQITCAEHIYFDQDKYYGVYEPDGFSELWIHAQVAPFDATYQELEWSSSNKDVAYCYDGTVEFAGPGDAVITARTKDGCEASVPIHVYSEEEYMEMGMPELYNGKVQESAELKIGEYQRLKVSYDQEEGKVVSEPKFAALDEGIVEIGESGVIKGIGAGSTMVICVDAQEISVCRVTVKGGDPEPEPEPGIGDTVSEDGISYVITEKNEVKLSGLSRAKKSFHAPETVTIGKKEYKVTQIANSAFAGDTMLEKVWIPASVEIVGKSAFKGCKNLKKIYIYGKKVKIYDSSFSGISSRAVFYVRGDAVKYYRIVLKNKTLKKMVLGSTYVQKGIRYKVTANDSKSRTVTVMGLKKKSKKTISIPAYVTIKDKKYKVNRIASNAFKGKKLTSVSIGSNVKTIGTKAFYSCKKLKKITIRGKNVSIGTSAFSKISSKAKFYVPKASLKAYKAKLKKKTVRSI